MTEENPRIPVEEATASATPPSPVNLGTSTQAEELADAEHQKQFIYDVGKMQSYLRQCQTVGAGVVALIALSFSDLTGEIADDADSHTRLLFAAISTATVAAGVFDGIAWFYAHSHRDTQSSEVPTVKQVTAVRIQRRSTQVCGWLAVACLILAGGLYLATIWRWAA
jgi:hypothetical protein